MNILPNPIDSNFRKVKVPYVATLYPLSFPRILDPHFRFFNNPWGDHELSPIQKIWNKRQKEQGEIREVINCTKIDEQPSESDNEIAN